MKKTILPNGFTILTEERPYLKTATLSVVVGAGSYQEQDYPQGTAHFVEHMLFKGTTTRSAKALNKEMDGIGGSWNAYTDNEETKYYCTLASDYWQTGVGLLLDIIWHHTFPEEELDKERQVILEEICMYEDDPQSTVFDALHKWLHQHAPHKQSIIGTETSVNAVTRDDLVRFVEAYYQPNNLVFVATGNVDHEALVAYITSYGFTRNGQTTKLVKNAEPLNIQSTHITLTKDIQQSHLAFALPICPSDHDDVPALEVLNHLLGGSGSSRLYERMREDEGLCYTVFTDATYTTEEGFLQGYVATDQSQIPRVKAILVEELHRLQTIGITQEELTHFKNYTKGIMALQSESNGALNDLIGGAYLEGIDFDLSEWLDDIEHVTTDDIARVARTYLGANRLVFCEVSPNEDTQKSN